jgi:hypothetical protein
LDSTLQSRILLPNSNHLPNRAKEWMIFVECRRGAVSSTDPPFLNKIGHFRSEHIFPRSGIFPLAREPLFISIINRRDAP